MPAMPSGPARLLKPVPSRGLLCVGCRAFVAEVRPGGKLLCILCAHHAVDHGVSLEERVVVDGAELPKVCVAECDCLPGEIYPEWWYERLRAAREASPTTMPTHPLMRAAR